MRLKPIARKIFLFIVQIKDRKLFLISRQLQDGFILVASQVETIAIGTDHEKNLFCFKILSFANSQFIYFSAQFIYFCEHEKFGRQKTEIKSPT